MLHHDRQAERSRGVIRLFPLFAFALVPIALWQRWIFTFIPNYHMQHLLFYVALPVLCWAWTSGSWSPRRAWRRMLPLLPVAALVLAVQGVAAWNSVLRFPVEGVPVWRAVAVSLVKLGMQLPFIAFFMEFCHLLMEDSASRRNVVRGGVAGFVALCALCALQGVYAYGVGFGLATPDGMDWYADILRGIAAGLESRWGQAVYDFYGKGSYTLTIRRINGVFEEASALAVMLGVFFVPLGLGLMGLGDAERRGAWRIGLAVAVVAAMLMVLALTSTGLVLALVAMGLLASVLFRNSRRLGVAVLCATLVCAAAIALAVPRMPKYSRILVERVSLVNVEHLPRYVLGRELLRTAADHPIAGVGRGWSSLHVLERERYQAAAKKDRELSTWLMWGRLPILSALPELLAEYGFPVLLAAAFGLYGLWRRLRRLHALAPDSAALSFASAFCGPWLVMLLVASLGSFDIRNPLIALPFYCLLALARGAADDGAAGMRGEGAPA